ncbi:MAG: FtsX-like permease family protein, partial [Psychrosphaera sp.]|nr:FtsX-like permease family protein [Psychrosphaera sp.]
MAATRATKDPGQVNDQFSALLLKAKDPLAPKITEAEMKSWLNEYVSNHFEQPARFLSFMARQTVLFSAVGYRDQLLGDSQALLTVLSVAVIGLLLMATLNLLNLFIAHYQSRSKEMAIQISLGASLLRVRLMVILENLPSFLMAALGGLLVTGWVIKSLPIVAGQSLPMTESIGIDTVTVISSLVIIVLLAVLFSTLALIDVDKEALANNLNGSGKGVQSQNNQWLSSA